jgi:hypothetical protein
MSFFVLEISLIVFLPLQHSERIQSERPSVMMLGHSIPEEAQIGFLDIDGAYVPFVELGML